MDDELIRDNFTEVSDGKFVTTEGERELLYSYHSPTRQSFA